MCFIYSHAIDNFRLPRVKQNWDKQRTCHQAILDWNTLDSSISNLSTLHTVRKSVTVFVRTRFVTFTFFGISHGRVNQVVLLNI